MEFIINVLYEMEKGNFSFLIFLVGLAQLIVMIHNGRRKR